MAESNKVGSLYLEIRAQINKLSRDLSEAQGKVETSVKSMQKTIDRGLDFASVGAKIAAVAGAVYGLKKAFDTVQIGEQVMRQAAAFDNLAKSAGKASDDIIDSMRKMSRGMVSQSEIVRSAGTAMMLGIPADKLTELMRIAEATSRQTGQTVSDAFSDITLAVARESKMILDNLGILVDVEKAHKDYAASIGKAASALTDMERKQAFMNAVLAAGNEMVAKIGEAHAELGAAERASASFRNLLDEAAKIVAVALNPALEASATLVGTLARSMKEFRDIITPVSVAVSKMTAEQMEEEIARYDAMSPVRRAGAYTGQQRAQIEAMRKRLREMYYEAGTSEGRRFGAGNVFQRAAEAEREAARNEMTLELSRYKLQRQSMSYEMEGLYSVIASEKYAEEAAKKILEEERRALEALQAEVRKYTEEFEQAKIFGGEGSNYERMEAMLRGGGRIAQMEAERIRNMNAELDKAFAEENRRIAEQVRAWADANKEIIESEKRKQEILKDTANIMAQNFSNAFADIIMGTQSVEKAFRSMIGSIISGMIRLASQKGFEDLFGALMRGIPGLFGSGGAGLAINKPGYFASVQPFHGGGVVGYTGGAMRNVPAHLFAFAPRLHAGLYPGEYPAILQRGETVLPRGATTGNVINYYYISAIDTQSFLDAARRSGAVPILAAEDISRNGPLRTAIMSRAR